MNKLLLRTPLIRFFSIISIFFLILNLSYCGDVKNPVDSLGSTSLDSPRLFFPGCAAYSVHKFLVSQGTDVGMGEVAANFYDGQGAVSMAKMVDFINKKSILQSCVVHANWDEVMAFTGPIIIHLNIIYGGKKIGHYVVLAKNGKASSSFKIYNSEPSFGLDLHSLEKNYSGFSIVMLNEPLLSR